MQRTNRVISLLVLIAFLFNTAVQDLAFSQPLEYANIDKLAASSRVDDIGGIQLQDIARIMFNLEWQLKISAGKDEAVAVPILIKKANQFKDSIYKAPITFENPLQLFTNEIKPVSKNYYSVMCRIKDKQYGLRTYYAIFSTKRDKDEGFPIEVYTEEKWKELEKSIKSPEDLPKRQTQKPEDAKAIKRYIEHEKNIDAWIAEKMKDEENYKIFDSRLAETFVFAAAIMDQNFQDLFRTIFNQVEIHGWLGSLIGMLGLDRTNRIVLIKIKKGEKGPIIYENGREIEVKEHSSQNGIYLLIDEDSFATVKSLPWEDATFGRGFRIERIIKALTLKGEKDIFAQKINPRFIHGLGVAIFGLPYEITSDGRIINELDKIYDEISSNGGLNTEILNKISGSKSISKLKNVEKPNLDKNLLTRDYAMGEADKPSKDYETHSSDGRYVASAFPYQSKTDGIKYYNVKIYDLHNSRKLILDILATMEGAEQKGLKFKIEFAPDGSSVKITSAGIAKTYPLQKPPKEKPEQKVAPALKIESVLKDNFLKLQRITMPDTSLVPGRAFKLKAQKLQRRQEKLLQTIYRLILNYSDEIPHDTVVKNIEEKRIAGDIFDYSLYSGSDIPDAVAIYIEDIADYARKFIEVGKNGKIGISHIERHSLDSVTISGAIRALEIKDKKLLNRLVRELSKVDALIQEKQELVKEIKRTPEYYENLLDIIQNALADRSRTDQERYDAVLGILKSRDPALVEKLEGLRNLVGKSLREIGDAIEALKILEEGEEEIYYRAFISPPAGGAGSDYTSGKRPEDTKIPQEIKDLKDDRLNDILEFELNNLSPSDKISAHIELFRAGYEPEDQINQLYRMLEVEDLSTSDEARIHIALYPNSAERLSSLLEVDGLNRLDEIRLRAALHRFGYEPEIQRERLYHMLKFDLNTTSDKITAYIELFHAGYEPEEQIDKLNDILNFKQLTESDEIRIIATLPLGPGIEELKSTLKPSGLDLLDEIRTRLALLRWEEEKTGIVGKKRGRPYESGKSAETKSFKSSLPAKADGGVVLHGPDGIKADRVTKYPLASNKKVLVIELEKDQHIPFAGNTVEALKDKRLKNKVEVLTIAEVLDLAKELKSRMPEIVFAPINYPLIEATLKTYGSLSDLDVLYYDPLIRETGLNLFVPFEEPGDLEKTLRALELHKTQVRRTDYIKVTRWLSIWAGRLAKYLGWPVSDKALPSANAFIVTTIDAKGEFEYHKDKKFQIVGEGEKSKEGFEAIRIGPSSRAIIISPHPDDDIITVAGLTLKLLRAGARVINTVTYLCKWGVILTEEEIKKIQKEENLTEEEAQARRGELRRNEILEADKLLAQDLPGTLEVNIWEDLEFLAQRPDATFKENIEEPEVKAMFEKAVDRVVAYLRKLNITNPNEELFVAPYYQDSHPTHRAANAVFAEAIKRYSREKDLKGFRILFYLAAWAGGFDTYVPSKTNAGDSKTGDSGDLKERMEIARLFKQGLADLLGELTGGFGSKSPTAEEMGGNFPERFRREYYPRKDLIALGKSFEDIDVVGRDEGHIATEFAVRKSSDSRGKPTYVNIAKAALEIDGGDDYFIRPTIIEEDATIRPGDSVIMFNFRGDRAEPMLRILDGDPDFKHWPLEKLNLSILPFGVYNDKYFKARQITGLLEDKSYQNTLGEALAKAGKKQLRIAESEKFKHVTWFFDGLRELTEEDLPGLVQILVPSNKIERHDEMPEMKAEEIARRAIPYITGEGQEKVDFALINFANMDIVGHFDNFEAGVKAALAVDKQIGLLMETVQKAGGVLIVTADHGSGERMAKLDEEGNLIKRDGKIVPHRAHAFDNKVPFVVVGPGDLKFKDGGSIRNIAPTILELMGIEKPKEMDAESLLYGYRAGPLKGPVVLVVRDGWGVNKFDPKKNPEAFQFDATYQAKLRAQELKVQFYADKILDFPHTELWAHGEHIGHPPYQMGDSENGHFNIGAGRIVESSLAILDKMLANDDFVKTPAVRKVLDNAKKNGGRLHLIGMASEGGVHSHIEHLLKLLTAISKEEDIKDVVLQAIFDGRDVETTETAGWQSLERIKQHVLSLPNKFAQRFRIGSISGRFYPMDRDALNRDKKNELSEELWRKRVLPWYEAVVYGTGRRGADLIRQRLERSDSRALQEGHLTEEEIAPMRQWIKDNVKLSPNERIDGLRREFFEKEPLKDKYLAVREALEVVTANLIIEQKPEGLEKSGVIGNVIRSYSLNNAEKVLLAFLLLRPGQGAGEDNREILQTGKSGEKRIYFFGAGQTEGQGDMKELLGGKGANLAEMANLGMPVPPGFTITTKVALQYLKDGKYQYPEGLEQEIDTYLARLEAVRGKRLGDPEDPLLVSVRSGAAVSMPGMMDTILNLGLNDQAVEGLTLKTKNPRFAYDSYRRLIEMFGDVVLGIKRENFTQIMEKRKEEKGYTQDTQLTAKDMKYLVNKFKRVVKEETEQEFPQDPREQLRYAIDAVFKSSNNKRAIIYRKINEIPADTVSAVNVQSMVFGNTGDLSATGVTFTRDSSTGERRFNGEFLINAQGEDVVAGIRNVSPIKGLEAAMPDIYSQLLEYGQILENHFHDMQDIEFTIEDGKLFMLQTRVGKRSAQAMLRIAVEMAEKGLITKEEALRRVDIDRIEKELMHPIVDPKAAGKARKLATGTAASPGAAVGKAVFNSKDAEDWAMRGESVILVRVETSPDDLGGMVASKGILTAQGGTTSHAALVARGQGIPAVVGVGELKINDGAKKFGVRDVVVKQGDWITIDGSTGAVYLGQVPTIPSEIGQVQNGQMKPEDSLIYQNYEKLLKWADEIRATEVWANADTPEDAVRARRLGAQGIGLTRTEHMFRDIKDKAGRVIEPRLLAVQTMFLAKENSPEREAILGEIEEMQQRDFEKILEVMEGLPVTIRFLDPPVHEFLPDPNDEVTINVIAERLHISPEEVIQRIRATDEVNPMLGTRGVRLEIMNPSILKMQTKAMVQAYANLIRRGIRPKLKIMVPNVAWVEEFRQVRKVIEEVANEILDREQISGEDRKIEIGTMIEMPSAALTAEEIAKEADFFSFGTNDLTQFTFGMSRDDAAKSFLQLYLEKGIFQADPTQKLDAKAVYRLIKLAVQEGRISKPSLQCGICGEHGGEPGSIELFLKAGLNYVSASPLRLPIARLASAQAAIKLKAARSEAQEGDTQKGPGRASDGKFTKRPGESPATSKAMIKLQKEKDEIDAKIKRIKIKVKLEKVYETIVDELRKQGSLTDQGRFNIVLAMLKAKDVTSQYPELAGELEKLQNLIGKEDGEIIKGIEKLKHLSRIKRNILRLAFIVPVASGAGSDYAMKHDGKGFLETHSGGVARDNEGGIEKHNREMLEFLELQSNILRDRSDFTKEKDGIIIWSDGKEDGFRARFDLINKVVEITAENVGRSFKITLSKDKTSIQNFVGMASDGGSFEEREYNGNAFAGIGYDKVNSAFYIIVKDEAVPYLKGLTDWEARRAKIGTIIVTSESEFIKKLNQPTANIIMNDSFLPVLPAPATSETQPNIEYKEDVVIEPSIKDYISANLRNLDKLLPEGVDPDEVLNILAIWKQNFMTEEATGTARGQLQALSIPETTIDKLFKPFTMGTLPGDSAVGKTSDKIRDIQKVGIAFILLEEMVRENRITHRQINDIFMATWPIRLVLGISGQRFDETKTPISSLGKSLTLPEQEKAVVSKGIQAWARLVNSDRETAFSYIKRLNDLGDAIEAANMPRIEGGAKSSSATRKKPGKSPKDALKVISSSGLWEKESFTLEDYLKTYEAVRENYPGLGFKKLAKNPESTARGDLHYRPDSLVRQGILEIVNKGEIGKPYRYRLTLLGKFMVRVLQTKEVEGSLPLAEEASIDSAQSVSKIQVLGDALNEIRKMYEELEDLETLLEKDGPDFALATLIPWLKEKRKKLATSIWQELHERNRFTPREQFISAGKLKVGDVIIIESEGRLTESFFIITNKARGIVRGICFELGDFEHEFIEGKDLKSVGMLRYYKLDTGKVAGISTTQLEEVEALKKELSERLDEAKVLVKEQAKKDIVLDLADALERLSELEARAKREKWLNELSEFYKTIYERMSLIPVSIKSPIAKEYIIKRGDILVGVEKGEVMKFYIVKEEAPIGWDEMRVIAIKPDGVLEHGKKGSYISWWPKEYGLATFASENFGQLEVLADQIKSFINEQESHVGSEPAVAAAIEGAKLSDLASHPLVNALIASAIEGLSNQPFVTYDKDDDIYWFGDSAENNKTFLDIFNELAKAEAVRNGRKAPDITDEIAAAKGIVNRADLADKGKIEVNKAFVNDLKARLARQFEHFGVETGTCYIMGRYSGSRDKILDHARKVEQKIHKAVIEQVFGGDINKYREQRRNPDSSSIDTRNLNNRAGLIVKIDRFSSSLRGLYSYNEFAQLAHDKAEGYVPVGALASPTAVGGTQDGEMRIAESLKFGSQLTVLREIEKNAAEEIAAMKRTHAKEAGLAIEKDPRSPYNFLLPAEFFANNEFKEHLSKYGDRFNLNSVSGITTSPESFVANLLTKIKPGEENKTVALVPCGESGLSEAQIKILTDKGIRVVPIRFGDLTDLKSKDKSDRAQFQEETYAIMRLFRFIDEETLKKSPSAYISLSTYLKTHFGFSSEVALDNYIQAIATNRVSELIKGYLIYKPIIPRDAQKDYEEAARSLIFA